MSSSEQKTQRMRNFTMKVKGLKEKMSELYTSNCLKMKSCSKNNKLEEVVHDVLRKFKGKKMEKKKEETENDGRVSSMEEEEEEEEESMSKYSMLKKLSELDEKLEKTMERIEVIEAEFERELVRRCSSTVKDEKQMSDSDDESESGYCTPDS